MSTKRLSAEERRIEERRIEERRQAILKRPTWETTSSSNIMIDPRVTTRTTICYHARPESGEHAACDGRIIDEWEDGKEPTYKPCECPCHSEPHWQDRADLRFALQRLTEVQERLKGNHLAEEDSSTQAGLRIALDAIEQQLKWEENPAYRVDGGDIVDRAGAVLYESVFDPRMCNFSREQVRALLELLNEGWDHLSWEEIEPKVEARIAEYAAKAAEERDRI